MKVNRLASPPLDERRFKALNAGDVFTRGNKVPRDEDNPSFYVKVGTTNGGEPRCTNAVTVKTGTKSRINDEEKVVWWPDATLIPGLPAD